ncbi:MAG: glycoside hydrolase family 3 C-terminal domain-containing protein [Lachnospiraceae bacterium]|nr:glycoside hydrolase family 3 C-terminal domain-containing protein [Lachnospiraceae bacterium]
MSFVDEWIRRLPGNVGPLPGENEEDICLHSAEEGMVLLKNNGLLPLKDKKIALFGAGAVDTVIGGTGSGSTEPPYRINVERGLTEYGCEITSENWLKRFAQAGREANEKAGIDDFTKIWGGITILIDELQITEEELKEAGTADTAVYVIRRNAGEGEDRKNVKGDFLLSDTEYRNLSRITSAFQHTVVVLNTTVMDPGFVDEIPGIDAVLLMSLPGMLAGRALANILYGEVSPSGKLTDTWAKRYEDYATSEFFSDNDGNAQTEEYLEDIYVGYRYFDSFGISPRWSFGYGLSYTDFLVETKQVSADARNIQIQVRVKNTGESSGKEVVQVYVSAPDCETLPKVYQELKGFQKTKLLPPGGEEILTIVIPPPSLASYDEKKAAMMLSQGQYKLRVGTGSRQTKVAAVLELDQDVITEQLENRVVCGRKLECFCAPKREQSYEEAQVIPLFARDFETADRRNTGTDETVTYRRKGAEYQPYVAQNPYQMDYPTTERVVEVKDAGGATFFDVAEQKVTVEEFVASLDTEVLLRLVTGVSHETPYPVQKRTERELKPVNAIASSGRTTAQYADSLGIPNSYLSDGPAGLRIIGKPTAAWPVGTLLAQTWNVELIRAVGDGYGTEMEAYHHSVLLAPGINIHRDPLCGRSFEYYSEDPFLTGKMAAAFIDGVQAHPGCLVAIKHLACNSQETDRGISDSIVGERALREIYLKAFEIAVKEAKAGTIMTAYNKINGVHVSENRELLEHIIRGEWGFEGIFMTDWHTESYKPADIHAGNDLIMGGVQVEAIRDAMDGKQPVFLEDGSVEVKTIISYDGLKREEIEQWGAFLPCRDGKDQVSVAVPPEIPVGESALEYEKQGIAGIAVQEDGSRIITYKGIRRGRHLALGDLQNCAIHVLQYLLKTNAWQEFKKQ